MWYIGWILGLGVACGFVIHSALRFERDADHNR